MASLTETSIIARKIIRYGIYAVILIMIARVTFIAGKGVYQRLFPAPPPEPTVDFGKLPMLALPPRAQQGNLTFQLETPDGNLPTFPDQTKVYVMPPFSASIGDEDRAKDKARKLGFSANGEPYENVKNIYRFEKNSTPSTLVMNIITGIFSISYDISSDPAVVNKTPPPPEDAIKTVTGLLNGAGVMSEDLTGPRTHQFLRLENGSFVNAVSLSDAKAIKVNLFRKNYGDEFPGVTPNADEANVWFILGGETGPRQIILAEFYYYPIEKDRYGTYPLKTAETAWEKLKNGQAYIANMGTHKDGDTIVIRRVYLAYYDAGQYAEFYQPVIVFDEANNQGTSFTAYVPAVTDEWYGAESSSE